MCYMLYLTPTDRGIEELFKEIDVNSKYTIYLSIYLSVCLSVYMSTTLPSVCISVFAYMNMYVHVYARDIVDRGIQNSVI